MAPTIARPVITKPDEAVSSGANLAACTASGTRYVLNGAYTISTSGIVLTGHDIAFVVASGGHATVTINSPDPGKRPDGTQKGNFAKGWITEGQRISFDEIEYIGGQFTQAAIGVRGTDISITNCITHSQLTQMLGCNRVLIDNWMVAGAGILPSYGNVTAPGPVNQNIVIQNSDANGSLHQHIGRFWSFDGIWFIDNNWKNNIGGPGQVINLRQGKNAYVVRGKYVGSEVFGPLEIASQPDTDRVEKVWIADSDFSIGGWQLPSGLIDLHVWNSRIDASSDSYVFTLRRSYHGRPMATGVLENCQITGRKLASNESPVPLDTLLKFPTSVSKSSFNGSPL